jgi:very-short-patch-repair endonuclease
MTRTVVQHARALRKSMTDAEVRLWSRLKLLRAKGYHFRRQVPFRGYILDFACFDRRLVVELDGWRHGEDDHTMRDQIRDAVLRREDFEVLRFWNRTLDENIGAVVHSIICGLEERPSTKALKICRTVAAAPHPPSPSATVPPPHEGRESPVSD